MQKPENTIVRLTSTQNTGNPVFDATVNIAMAIGNNAPDTLQKTHEILLELYEQEPKPTGPKKTLGEMADIAASE